MEVYFKGESLTGLTTDDVNAAVNKTLSGLKTFDYNGNIYSTDKDLVVGIAIDGRKLYRKVVRGSLTFSEVGVRTSETIYQFISLEKDNISVQNLYGIADDGANITNIPTIYVGYSNQVLSYICLEHYDVTNSIVAIGQMWQPCSFTITAAIEYTRLNEDPVDQSKNWLAPSLYEYDTDDGWHVRKWSTGYLEMVYNGSFVIPSGYEFIAWGGMYRAADGIIPHVNFPLTLTKKFSEDVNILQISPSDVSVTIYDMRDNNDAGLTRTNRHGLCRGSALTLSQDITFDYAVRVTGLWK